MRKDDQGAAPHGGVLLHDSAAAGSGESVRPQPARPPGSAPGVTSEGGGGGADAAGGATDPATGPGTADEPEIAPVVSGKALPQPALPANVTRWTDEIADTGPQPAIPAEAPEPPAVPAGHTSALEAPGPAAGRAPGVIARTVADTPEPSLARVLATTIQLWGTRRLRKIGIGRRRSPYQGAPASYREPAARTRTARRWRLAAIVLAVVILALVAVQLSGLLNRSASSGGPAPRPGNGGTSSLPAAASARAEAAAWVALQVGSDNIIACDPVMCSALLGRGIPAGRLLPLQSAGSNPFGADVIVASPSVRSEYGSELTNAYAPALIASFGTGTTRVDVRAIASQGGAAYRAAEQSDLSARQAAGAQLLRNPRFRVSAPAGRQIAAGQVDARLLVTLASLVSQRPVSVSSFGDTGPGAPVQFRQVTIMSPGGQDTALAADLDQVRTQRAPYLPERANIVHPGGPAVLRIEFGAPGLQGLLTGGNSSLYIALGGELMYRDGRLSSGRAFI